MSFFELEIDQFNSRTKINSCRIKTHSSPVSSSSCPQFIAVSSLEANLDVDDNNTAAIVYDLTSFERPDHKACLLKWTYRSGDYEVTPMYNLGTESLGVIGSYTIDSENRLRASYDLNSNMGSIQWTNASGAGIGGGDLRITASANLADADSAKQMPTLLVEKTWSMDV